MNALNTLLAVVTLFVFLLFAWCFVITDFQAKRRGILGCPARFIFFCLKMLHLADEWIRKITGNLREAIYLPVGKYVIRSLKEGQIIQRHRLYDLKAEVSGNGKEWTVVSQRLPIQIPLLLKSSPLKTFSVVITGGRKKIVAG